MSCAVKMKSLMRNLRAVFHQYLHEITIHGLRYIIDGRNWFEVAARGTVIALCFILSFAGVYTSINESIKNPLLTSIQTTLIQNVSKILYISEIRSNKNNRIKMSYSQ